MKQYLEAGEFVSTHGITGELKLYPWCDSADFLMQFNTFYLDANGTKPVKVERTRIHKGMCLVVLAGVTDIASARPYIGKTAYIARADVQLEDGRVFVQDLLGALVRDAVTGQEYGRITAITHPGHHDVYEVTAQDGQAHLFPAVDAFVREINPAEGYVSVCPIEGMFVEEEPRAPKKEKRKRKTKEAGI